MASGEGARIRARAALAALLLCAVGVPVAKAADPCLDDVVRLCSLEWRMSSRIPGALTSPLR